MLGYLELRRELHLSSMISHTTREDCCAQSFYGHKRRLLAAEKIFRSSQRNEEEMKRLGRWENLVEERENGCARVWLTAGEAVFINSRITTESNSLVASIHVWISRTEMGAPFTHNHKSHHKRRLLCAKFPWTQRKTSRC
ncbi:hypothetical protein CDAR_232281 [Caerostris darwini]|uniref:Uncharacterized protein n=1 Tax=Caerostris darwini TaxID=1538125 RepID=A0AAV4W694_9ARAC|nr:hypothetical protein CDAR_232281 [Caerostris darwini]